MYFFFMFFFCFVHKTRVKFIDEEKVLKKVLRFSFYNADTQKNKNKKKKKNQKNQKNQKNGDKTR